MAKMNTAILLTNVTSNEYSYRATQNKLCVKEVETTKTCEDKGFDIKKHFVMSERGRFGFPNVSIYLNIMQFVITNNVSNVIMDDLEFHIEKMHPGIRIILRESSRLFDINNLPNGLFVRASAPQLDLFEDQKNFLS